MKLHQRITELVLKYRETLGGSGVHRLAIPVDGIDEIDAYRSYEYDGAEISTPLQDWPDHKLIEILLDPAIKRDFTRVVNGVGTQVEKEDKTYTMFSYDYNRLRVLVRSNGLSVVFEFSDQVGCFVETGSLNLLIFNEKFWDDLRLWPNFTKEYLVHVLDSHGFKFLP